MNRLSNDIDLLNFPHEPGHRGIDTSIEAADAIAPTVGRLQKFVLAAVARAGPQGLTVVELSQRLSHDRMSIQPRFSELRALQRIADSKLRRKNPSGINAIVWTLPEYVRQEGGAR